VSSFGHSAPIIASQLANKGLSPKLLARVPMPVWLQANKGLLPKMLARLWAKRQSQLTQPQLPNLELATTAVAVALPMQPQTLAMQRAKHPTKQWLVTAIEIPKLLEQPLRMNPNCCALFRDMEKVPPLVCTTMPLTPSGTFHR